MNQRLYYMDFCRAFLMLLGIPYRAGQVFGPDPWVVNPATTSVLLGHVNDIIHAFRMPAFFLLAGFFSLLVIRKSGLVAWLMARLARLGLPLLVSILLLNIPAMYVASVALHPAEGVAPSFLAQLTSPGGHWLGHLWFLLDLLLMCGLLAALLPLRRLAPAPLERMAGRVLSSDLLLVALMVVWRLGLKTLDERLLGGHLEQAFGGTVNLRELLLYFPFFLMGTWLLARPEAFDRFTHPGWSTLLLFAAGLGLLLLQRHVEQGVVTQVSGVLLFALMGLTGTRLLLAVARRLVHTGHPAVNELVRSAFTIYLFHYLVVMLVAEGSIRLGLDMPLLGWVIAVAAGLGVSYLIHRFVIGRSRWLLWLFNGIPLSRTRPGLAGKVAPRTVPPGSVLSPSPRIG
ncbi:Glucans biosynthesis protein mdoC [Roseomonas mucosa]|uniref:Glucans biosynthesis protein mdoC n=1 Tax=Roseomonas mucosa TaxID=207340 RepID=A0A4Y1MWX3_9PROT|nr:acyltransferase family protein [Roseomonas mucosa]AWV22431.1 Glucans biosynthesis protein mdoC [Roseomonas mucosa]MDT8353018.1 acyltransferase family protein [Roseomonas mucosa]